MSSALPHEEHETKYVFPNIRAPILRQFLARRYELDGEYASGLISSIYFDTDHLALLDEKLNSDYLKTKVRLRWYSSDQTRTPYPSVFLEVKRKVGSARRKVRYPFDLNSDWVLARPLHDPAFLQINTILAKRGEQFGQTLFPILQINYHRTRYYDPLTGSRLAVDSDINVSRINGRMINQPNGTSLKEAVFECKNHTQDLPDWLIQVNTLANCRKDSFSKYAACYLHARRFIT